LLSLQGSFRSGNVLLLTGLAAPPLTDMGLSPSFVRTESLVPLWPVRFGIVVAQKSTMAKTLKRGDHVAWNSEAGRVTGIIQKKITSEIVFKGYQRHASKAEPQYLIKSDKTDHVAIHKASALTRIPGKG